MLQMNSDLIIVTQHEIVYVLVITISFYPYLLNHMRYRDGCVLVLMILIGIHGCVLDKVTNDVKVNVNHTV